MFLFVCFFNPGVANEKMNDSIIGTVGYSEGWDKEEEEEDMVKCGKQKWFMEGEEEEEDHGYLDKMVRIYFVLFCLVG